MNKKINIKKLIAIILITLSVLFIAGVILTKILFNINFGGGSEIRTYSGYYIYEDIKDKYPREQITFDSGENTLTGYIYAPENKKGLIVFAHGIGSYADNYLSLQTAFIDMGYSVFSYDSTGCGNSEGKGVVGLCQSALDLDAALTYIEGSEMFENIPLLVMGHSWGGYAAAEILRYDHDIAASVSISGYSEPLEMISAEAENIVPAPLAKLLYPAMLINQYMLFGDIYNNSAAEAVSNTDIPVLIIHGADDDFIIPDGQGIIKYKNEINNPHAEFFYAPNRGHSDLWWADSAVEYNNEINRLYEEFYKSQNGEITESEDMAWYAENIDKAERSRLDDSFIALIDDFYTRAIISRT
ncbi:MAG: alpha/beta fold hydrolase [Oscillospiraceae bacterium]|nr:alpha/beta fold hydrolase [Oscillospiraceae bacterium]